MVIVVILWQDRILLKRVDYYLLGTFICFFVFIGNLSHFAMLNAYLNSCFQSSTSSYVGSILLSQIISNVPSAILMANYSKQWTAVLLGVNVGGMGTLIASMASVIAYRYYVREYKNKGYLLQFLQYNLISLVLFSVLAYYWINSI